jgi:hypothetical protein
MKRMKGRTSNMGKVKKDDMFCCANCGLEVVVNKACACIDTELMCCGGPMVRKNSSSGRTNKNATGKAAETSKT